MDKAKIYPKIGRMLLAVWIITWVALIWKSSMPYNGFNNLMFNIFFATVMNFTFNPCAFIGAVLLDSVTMREMPERRIAWFRLIIIYLIIWAILLTFVIRNVINRETIAKILVIEKPLSK